MSSEPATAPRLERIATLAVVALVALSPWPLGSRLPWAAMLVAMAALVAAVAWFASALLRGRPIHWHATFGVGLAFLAWTALQWAAGWSVYAHGSAVGWIERAAWLALFALVVQLAANAGNAARIQRAIAWTGLAVAFFGLVQFLTWNGLLYWFYEPPYEGTRFGPFNNRNYFAGYLAATLPMALATGLLDRRAEERVWVLYLAWLGFLAGLMSLSRGGAVAMLAAAAFVVLGSGMEWMRRSRAARWGTIAGAALAVLIGLAGLQQIDRVMARLETMFLPQEVSPLTSRVEIWRDTLMLIAERPLQGWGLDTYGWVATNAQSASSSTVPMHAHDEYLELAMEAGLPGAALAAVFVLLLMRSGVAAYRDAERSGDRSRRLGALAGWGALLLYGLTDLPTVIPAINVVLAVLAGLLVATRKPKNRATE